MMRSECPACRWRACANCESWEGNAEALEMAWCRVLRRQTHAEGHPCQRDDWKPREGAVAEFKRKGVIR